MDYNLSNPTIPYYFNRIFGKHFPYLGHSDHGRETIKKYGETLCMTSIYDINMLKYGPFMIGVLAVYKGIQLYY